MMAEHDTIEIDSIGIKVFKQTNDFSLDSNCSWIEAEKKPQPWWQTTHTYELASFVSQKSLNHIENCDLPPPQKYLTGQTYPNINDDKIKTAAKSSAFSNLTVQPKGSLESGLMHGKPEHLCFDSDKSSSYPTINKGGTEQVFGGDPSKAQLLEALCHSQTRARVAEEVAKQAYAEKEHTISFLFIQTSQLFAYKQLETLNNQIKNKDKPISTLFPMVFPWMSFEGTKHCNRKHQFAIAKQEMVGNTKSDVTTTYAVAFALGLSLVGAGLLLGWTVGWMLTNL